MNTLCLCAVLQEAGALTKDEKTTTTVNKIVISHNGNKEVEDNNPEGFRHTNAVRNSIRKGRSRSSHERRRQQVIGTGHQSHNLQVQKDARNFDTNLVYIGRLSAETSENGLREYMSKVGIPVKSVADVIKLKSRNPEASSFCISLSPENQEVEDKVFNADTWPRGTLIRPYNENPRKSRRNKIQFTAPRFNRRKHIPRSHQKYDASHRNDFYQNHCQNDHHYEYINGHEWDRYTQLDEDHVYWR